VRGRIEKACAAAGRSPEDVRLLAVSKYAGADAVRDLAAAGQSLFGENRVQEATAKIASLASEASRGAPLQWHLIGHLQTNKARAAVDAFAAVESVDSLHVAEELSRRALEAGRVLPVLVQVNVDNDPAKQGFYTGQVDGVYAAITALAGLQVQGLMTIGTLATTPSAARPTFAALRELRVRLDRLGVAEPLRHLSMGMSFDYEVAIAEGATIVRVGSALFGRQSR
jgi:pyridoxal phosphate enzyme (YggS family)